MIFKFIHSFLHQFIHKFFRLSIAGDVVLYVFVSYRFSPFPSSPFPPRLHSQEILSVVVTPLILCLSLPECAGDILSFLKTHHQTVEGLGSVCAFSLFDLEKYGSHRYGGIEKERGGRRRTGGRRGRKSGEELVEFLCELSRVAGGGAGARSAATVGNISREGGVGRGRREAGGRGG